MTEDLLSKTRLLIEKSAFSQQLSEFCMWLQAERYSVWTTHLHVLRLEQTLPMMRAAGPAELLGSNDLISAFDSNQGPPTRRKYVAATRRAYTRFLRSCGRLRDDMANDRFSALLRAYDRHLLDLRGLSESSRVHHALTVSAFLAHAVGAQQQLSAITQIDVERFVARRSKEVSRHSMQHVIAHLRAFLRYCRDHGTSRRHSTQSTHRERTARSCRPEHFPGRPSSVCSRRSTTRASAGGETIASFIYWRTTACDHPRS